MTRPSTLLLNLCRWAPTACQSCLEEGGSKTKFFRKLRFVDRTACSIIKPSTLLQFEFPITAPQNKQLSQSPRGPRANVNKLSQHAAECVLLNHRQPNPRKLQEKFCQYSCELVLQYPGSWFSLHSPRGIIKQHLTMSYSCGAADQAENHWVPSRSRGRFRGGHSHQLHCCAQSQATAGTRAVPTVYTFCGAA